MYIYVYVYVYVTFMILYIYIMQAYYICIKTLTSSLRPHALVAQGLIH